MHIAAFAIVCLKILFTEIVPNSSFAIIVMLTFLLTSNKHSIYFAILAISLDCFSYYFHPNKNTHNLFEFFASIIITACIAILIIHFREISEALKEKELKLRNILTDKKKSEEQLIWLSIHDELTGIYNRRYFNQQIELEWRRLQRHSSDQLSLIIIDVDYFKHYNDTLGHQAGDECLKVVAQALSRVLRRASDFVARYGGEEFVVLLPNTNLTGMVKVAESIQREIYTLNLPHPVSEIGGRVTVSLGLSTMTPTRACEAEVLIKQADFALYQAKNSGRNQYRIYTRPEL